MMMCLLILCHTPYPRCMLKALTLLPRPMDQCALDLHSERGINLRFYFTLHFGKL